jgi:hypothetical protein
MCCSCCCFVYMHAGRGEQPPLDEVMRILRGWKDLPREKLLLAFEAGHFAGVEEMKQNPRLFDRVAPMGVNDIMMAVQYRYDESRSPLNIPVVAFDGTKDNTIPKGYMKGWRKHTSARYRHVYIPGTHYFVSSEYRKVTAEVSSECLMAIEGMQGGILGAEHSWVGASAADRQGLADGQGASRGRASAAVSLSSVMLHWDNYMRTMVMVAIAFITILLWMLWSRSRR